MTKKEKQYLQKLEGEAWLKLTRAHYDFMVKHGTFNSVEEYDEALSADMRHKLCLRKWATLNTILEHFNIPSDDKTHKEAFSLILKEPKSFK